MAVLRRTGLIHSLTGATANLARSVVTQVTVSASTAVIIGLTGSAWLNRDAPPVPPAAGTPQVIVLAPAPAFPSRAGGPSVTPVSSFAWGGVESTATHTPGAFPMEEEARFGLSLSRPYKVTADAVWSARKDANTSGDVAQQATIAEEAQVQLGKRRGGIEMTELRELAPAPAVMPPSRPLDLSAYAVPAAQAAVDHEPLRYTVLPDTLLPNPLEVASRVVTQADAARAALLKSVTWAAGTVSSALPGN